MRDLIAEHAVLGGVMLNPKTAGPHLLNLDPEEFSPGKEQALAGLLIDMIRRGDAIDIVTVHNEAVARGIRPSELTASYLHHVSNSAITPLLAGSYAVQVREMHRQNRLLYQFRAMTSRLETRDDTGTLEDLDELREAALSSLNTLPEPLDRVTADPPRTLDDLLAVKPSFDWLVPHLLERGERLMLTGQEGLGKSYLLRQLACCLAAGVHPFTGQRFGDGLRVLHVDAENGVGQSRRAYSEIAAVLSYLSPVKGWRGNLMIETRADGLDLPGEDRAWWDRICSAAAPDVIITGPIYRLFMGNPNAEEDVRKLIAALDAPRVRHGAALILEAHAGHGQQGQKRAMRPSGASMWLRWPENGLGLIRSENDAGNQRAMRVDVQQWRMAREDRAWPEQLEHGRAGLHQLPWIPASAYYTGRIERYEETA